ncbi:integral membrane protein [Mycobacterium tuberculosis T92]|nr:integral membrane protein [Mycobacterium tuberculosis T92]
MATDGCHDSACDASYHVFPAMVTMWIGVGAVLLLTLVVMVRNSSRGNVVIGWPLLGCWRLALSTWLPMRSCTDRRGVLRQ